MKKQRKQKPKARSRAQGSSAAASGRRAHHAASGSRAQRHQSSHHHASYGGSRGKSGRGGIDVFSWLPSAEAMMAVARTGMQAVEGQARRVHAFAFDDVPQHVRPHVSRMRSAARAAAHAYSPDDRELAGLLILPFLIIATAMVIGQSVRRWENFEVPVAYERPSLDSARLAKARAIAAAPVVPLALRTETPRELSTRMAADFRAASLDQFRSAETSPVTSSETLVATGGAPDAAARVVGSVDPLGAVSAREQQLAMLVAPREAQSDLGPGRALAPAPLTERPAFDDDGSFEGAKHMCLAPPAAAKKVAATPKPEMFGLMLAEAARDQTESFVIYNDAYRTISYPGGDVPQIFGVCTDVIVRAYRALGIDLQQAVHEAKVGSGDINIDHRRVEVLRRFFAKVGESLPITDVAEDYQPGDIVSYYRPQNQHTRSHIAIVSSVVAPSGRLMIIHNRGWGPQLEDGLFVDQITGHYRWAGRSPASVAVDPLAKGLRASQVTPASLSVSQPPRKK